MSQKSHLVMGSCRSARQKGITLIVVVVFVLLSMLLALWASRTAMYSELVVGNDVDYQRAYEAAQALVLDAEMDIRGKRADGKACALALPSGASNDVCRRGTTTKIPVETADLPAFLAMLSSKPARCVDGLCAKRVGRQDFWNTTATVPSSMQTGEKRLSELAANGIGARYGQYTGAQIGDTSSPANPILQDRSAATTGGWYWVEVLPYVDSKAGLITNAASNQLELTGLAPHAVFRITAIAYGRKPGTLVVLEESYARPMEKD
ncbi:pilus assembly PilX family protein [Comamonas sp. J-3]|uniref:pilus assembly PilX family protein n=1 Tax=Comamonas trifloxystrobinivorans TaxID=3350256 RepID=UPI00372D0E93